MTTFDTFLTCSTVMLLTLDTENIYYHSWGFCSECFQPTRIWANDACSLSCSTIIHSVVGAVKEGGFWARALHLVHLEGAGDWSKLWFHSGLPVQVPQHPREICCKILGRKYLQKGKIHFKFLFLANLQTTRAFCASCPSSQTGSPPTRMFPSWGPVPPTRVTSEICSRD